jgi:hypothetical protein
MKTTKSARRRMKEVGQIHKDRSRSVFTAVMAGLSGGDYPVQVQGLDGGVTTVTKGFYITHRGAEKFREIIERRLGSENRYSPEMIPQLAEAYFQQIVRYVSRSHKHYNPRSSGMCLTDFCSS